MSKIECAIGYIRVVSYRGRPEQELAAQCQLDLIDLTARRLGATLGQIYGDQTFRRIPLAGGLDDALILIEAGEAAFLIVSSHRVLAPVDELGAMSINWNVHRDTLLSIERRVTGAGATIVAGDGEPLEALLN